ncbi:hypothetical protein [Tuwongella immobilis]|uniref:hypothetical protein n=1 Tax=Tuwongella immobilis TaxID=692036 RepID=UPI001E573C97|nr:hypothetical protein [Tuwongella immobilis]
MLTHNHKLEWLKIMKYITVKYLLLSILIIVGIILAAILYWVYKEIFPSTKGVVIHGEMGNLQIVCIGETLGTQIKPISIFAPGLLGFGDHINLGFSFFSLQRAYSEKDKWLSLLIDGNCNPDCLVIYSNNKLERIPLMSLPAKREPYLQRYRLELNRPQVIPLEALTHGTEEVRQRLKPENN